MFRESPSFAARSTATEGRCLCFVRPKQRQSGLNKVLKDLRDAVRSCHPKHGTVGCVFSSRRTDPNTYTHRTWLNRLHRSLSFSYTSCQSSLPSISAMASSTHSTSPPPPSNHKPRKRRSRVKSLPTLNANGQDRDDTTLKRCNSFPVVSKVSFISLIQVGL